MCVCVCLCAALQLALSEERDRPYPRPGNAKVVRGRGCNESFRAAVDRSYEAPLGDERAAQRAAMDTGQWRPADRAGRGAEGARSGNRTT